MRKHRKPAKKKRRSPKPEIRQATGVLGVSSFGLIHFGLCRNGDDELVVLAICPSCLRWGEVGTPKQMLDSRERFRCRCGFARELDAKERRELSTWAWCMFTLDALAHAYHQSGRFGVKGFWQ